MMHFFLILLATLLNQTAYSKDQGPSVSHSRRAKSSARIEKSNEKFENERVKTEAEIFIPSGSFSLGNLYLGTNIAQETYTYFNENNIKPTAEKFDTMSLAGAFVFNAEKDSPKYFIFLATHGYIDYSKPIHRLKEYVAGVSLDHLPFHLNISKTSKNNFKAIVRLREYPTYNDYLLQLTYQFNLGEYWRFKVSYPDALSATWTALDEKLSFYFKVSGNSLQYPLYFNNEHRWLKGYTLSIFTGIKKHLSQFLSLVFDAGVQSDEMMIKDHDDIEFQRNSDFSPWIKVSLESWFD